ncbi:hypothetical protein Patl1_05061 [Pistacia atlantica]|uniref:Uncharacterized protein n=1 Tax=Pistacia atlantica TaxID=434234 RepID=A0ACC1BPQ0_9ROSI|nr:hypothetical protein Patl1_05061 [Pistacia atlantica]
MPIIQGNFGVKSMAKLQAARISTEVAPPQFISVAKRPLKIMLATIVEEEKDFGVHNNESLSSISARGSTAMYLSRQIEKSLLRSASHGQAK